jgi:hypothetical protein
MRHQAGIAAPVSVSERLSVTQVSLDNKTLAAFEQSRLSGGRHA